MSVTNQLEIDIKAKSEKAIPTLDTLIGKLNEVNAALNNINPQNLQNIANSLKGLKGVKVNVGGGSSSSGANDQFVRTNSLLQTLTNTSNRANSSFLNLNKTMFKMAATWGMFYASAYPFIKLLNKAWDSAQTGMDYVETYNYFSVTMDKLGKESADAYANSYINQINRLNEQMTGFSLGANGELFETYSKNLGADAERLLNYQARIGAVTNAVGLLGDASLSTQKALSMLSQDLSSLTNTDLESVMTNLSSGLIGQSRALYKYGIDITNATLKTYAYENGITKAVSAMTQAEKMQLRVLAILDQSKVAWGDMANTVNSVANQYRIFGQSVNNLSRVLGNIFLPIVAKVLPYVNALLISLRQIFTMLGFKLYGKNWLSDVLDGISSGYSGGEIADGLEDIEDAADGATKSAKKLKQAVMGFDELNIINPNSSGGSGSGAGGGGFDLSDAIADALGDYDSIWNKAFADAENKAVTLANRIMSYIRRGNFEGLGKWISDSLASQLNSINWNKIYEGARNFGTGLAQFLNGLVQPNTFYAVGKTVANSLNTAIYTALAFGKEFDFKKLGVAIGSYWNGIFENFDFAAFGETVGIWVGGITKTIATAVKKIKWDKLFDGIKKAFDSFFKGLAESGVTISDIAIVIGVLTIKKILKFAWGAAIGKAISQSLAKVIAAKLGTEIAADAGIGTALAQGFTIQFRNLGSKLSGMFSNMALKAADFETLNAALTSTFGGIATTIAGIGTTIGGVSLAVHEFFDMWSNGWDIMSEVLKDIGLGIGALGTVMLGLVSGPVAVVGAAILAIGSTALIVAHDQIPDVSDAIKEALTNPGGTPISDITDEVSEKILKVGDAFNTLTKNFEENDRLKSSIEDSSNEILKIKASMDADVISVEEGVEKMGSQFETLFNATKQWFDLMATQIQQVFGEGGVFEGYLEKQGTTVEQVTQTTITLGDTVTKEMQDAWNEYMSLPLEEQESARGQQLLAIATGTTDDFKKILSGFSSDITAEIENIDWSTLMNPDGTINQEAWESEMSKLTDAIATSQQSIQDTSDKLIENWEELKLKAEEQGDETAAGYYQALINATEQGSNDVQNQIIEEGKKYTDAIQLNFLGKMKETISKQNTDAEAQEVVNNMTSSLNTISSSIEDNMSQLGEDGAGWGLQASQKIADSIFDKKVFEAENGGMVDVQDSLKGNWKTIFDNTVAEVQPKAKESGKNIMHGLVDGINSVFSDFTTTMSNVASSGIGEFNKEAGIHSPSTVMYSDGNFLMVGLDNGVKDNSKLPIKSMKDVAKSITDAFFNGLKDWQTQMDSWFNNDVQSWFSADKWSQLGDNIKTGIANKWAEIRVDTAAQWTTIQTDLTNKWKAITDNATATWTNLLTLVQTKWSEIKDDTFSKWLTIRSDLTDQWRNMVADATITWTNLRDLITTKWTEIKDDTFLKWSAIQTDLSTKFTAIKTDATNNFNTLKTNVINAFEGVKTGIKSPINGIIDLVEGMVNKIADGFNAIADAIKDLTTFEWTNPLTGTVHHSDGISLPKISHLTIPRFAIGGFPEDGLFFANHHELVGQFSNGQNVVANNEQIVEGIANGVRSAVNEALAPYLRDIANNTSETAQNTDEIKRKPTQTLTNRQIAHANNIGQRSLGLKLRTT